MKKGLVIIIALIVIAAIGVYIFQSDSLFWERTTTEPPAGGVHAVLNSFSVSPANVVVGDEIAISYSVTNDGTDAATYIDICLILDWNGNEQRDDFDTDPNTVNCPFFPTSPGIVHTSDYSITVQDTWVDTNTNTIPLCLYVKMTNEATGGWYEFGQAYTLNVITCQEGEGECQGDEYWECVGGEWVRNAEKDGECLSSYTLTVNTDPEECAVFLDGDGYFDVNISYGGQSVFGVDEGVYTMNVSKTGYKLHSEILNITGDLTVEVVLEEGEDEPDPSPGFELIAVIIALGAIYIFKKKKR